MEQINIELEDLKELASINPVAWEQLLHIADNRINAAKIADLEAHLEQAHKYGAARAQASLPEHRLITKAELDSKNGIQASSLQ